MIKYDEAKKSYTVSYSRRHPVTKESTSLRRIGIKTMEEAKKVYNELIDGREVLDRVLAQGRTKAFQKRLKNTINMISNWGIESKIIRGVSHSPVFGLKIVLKEDKKPEILKLEEIRRLLKEARERNHPWYPIWAVALLTGMRNGELFALKWSDVDLEKGLITVQRSYNKRTKEFKSTKAGYWRTVPISEELKCLLLDLRHHHHDHGYHGGRGGFGRDDGGDEPSNYWGFQ